jgi:GNAT superfamily N-acetyltransferase
MWDIGSLFSKALHRVHRGPAGKLGDTRQGRSSMNYKIEIYPAEKLSSERRLELEKWFEKEFSYIPLQWAEPAWYVLALSDSVLIGRVGILGRKVSINGSILAIAGISGVITATEWQGQGVGTAMVKSAAEFICTQLGLHYSLLLCRSRVAPFYAKLGWRIVEGPTTFDQPSGKMVFPRLTMILECGEKQWPKGPIDLCGLPW